jgi:DNA invertase Pin-like site-specific DNA recombinase
MSQPLSEGARMTSAGSPTAPPKAYSYIRFSTPEQAKGDSLRRQTDDARAFAARKGITLDEELTVRDEGISAFYGRNAQTGALAAFLEAAREGIVPQGSYLIVESLDRISRQTVRKAIRTLEEIIEAGVNVVDLSDGGKVYNVETLETDQMSFLLMAMRFIRANEESATKSRRVRSAYDKKRKDAAAGVKGKPFTRQLPAWLIWNEGTKAHQVIPERAAVVRKIYEMADRGMSHHGIARTLNESGESTWGGDNSRAPYWRGTYVRKLLTTSAVMGTFTPHQITKTAKGRERKPLDPIEGYWPSVVEPELFERVSARLRTTSARGKNTNTEPKSIFGGVMKCAYCGDTVTRVSKGEHVYLVCTRAHARAKCRYEATRYRDVEQRFIEVADLIVDDAPRGQRTTELEQQIANLSAGIDGLITQEQDFADLWQGEKTEAARRRWHDKTTERERAEAELRGLMTHRERMASKTVAKKLETLRAALKRKPIDVVEANRAVRQVISRIVMNPEQGRITIYWQHSERPSWPITFGGRHMKWENADSSDEALREH